MLSFNYYDFVRKLKAGNKNKQFTGYIAEQMS